MTVPGWSSRGRIQLATSRQALVPVNREGDMSRVHGLLHDSEQVIGHPIELDVLSTSMTHRLG